MQMPMHLKEQKRCRYEDNVYLPKNFLKAEMIFDKALLEELKRLKPFLLY